MIPLIEAFERNVLWLVWAALALAGFMMLAVIGQRVAITANEAWLERVRRRYEPLARRALAGDERAIEALSHTPSRHRIPIVRLLMLPLVADRDPAPIAATRRVVRAMSIVPMADRYLRSRWWWRRMVALQALGLAQMTERTAAIVGALDDPHPVVRGAALDALADLRNPQALPALVVRMHDGTLQRGRRAAALAAYGSGCEQFLLDLAHVDEQRRLSYARALAICGTAQSRATLCEWTTDARAEVRAAAFDALAHVGLDDRAAGFAIAALDSPEPAVRAMAAGALRGWSGPGGAAAHLAPHLDDTWAVAVRAARSLQSTPDGRAALETRAGRGGTAGDLARQMLWEAGARA